MLVEAQQRAEAAARAVAELEAHLAAAREAQRTAESEAAGLETRKGKYEEALRAWSVQDARKSDLAGLEAEMSGADVPTAAIPNFLVTHAQKYDPITVILDLGHSYRKLATLLQAGLTLAHSLQMLADQHHSQHQGAGHPLDGRHGFAKQQHAGEHAHHRDHIA